MALAASFKLDIVAVGELNTIFDEAVTNTLGVGEILGDCIRAVAINRTAAAEEIGISSGRLNVILDGSGITVEEAEKLTSWMLVNFDTEGEPIVREPIPTRKRKATPDAKPKPKKRPLASVKRPERKAEVDGDPDEDDWDSD